MPKTPTDSARAAALDDVVAERDELQLRLREAEERSLEFWVEAIIASAAGSTTVKALQQSFSWRVTKPLRAARLVYTKTRQSGVRRTARMVRERLAQIRQARKRG